MAIFGRFSFLVPQRPGDASRRILPSPSVLLGPYLVLPIELTITQPSNGVVAQILLPNPHDIAGLCRTL